MSAEAEFSYLPEVLAEIAQAAGIEAALKLARERGGTRVYIPARVREGHWLSETVGLAAAEAICQHFCTDGIGIYLVVPMARAAQARRVLVQALEEGLPADKAARRAGMHVRSAFRMRRRLKGRPDRGQGSLF